MDDRLKRLNKLTDRIEALCAEAKELEPTFHWQWNYTIEGRGGQWLPPTSPENETLTFAAPNGSTM